VCICSTNYVIETSVISLVLQNFAKHKMKSIKNRKGKIAQSDISYSFFSTPHKPFIGPVTNTVVVD